MDNQNSLTTSRLSDCSGIDTVSYRRLPEYRVPYDQLGDIFNTAYTLPFSHRTILHAMVIYIHLDCNDRHYYYKWKREEKRY